MKYLILDSLSPDLKAKALKIAREKRIPHDSNQ